MFLFERISNKISYNIATTLNLDKDHEEVLCYGAFNILQIFWSIFLVMILGFIFHVFLEALIISFTVSFLRKFSGGVHATSPNRCAAIGTVVCIVLSLNVTRIVISFNFIVVIFLLLISLIYSYYTVYKLAPIDSIAKPIVSIEKKQRLKRCSIILLSIMYLCILFLLLDYALLGTASWFKCALAITSGIMWQTFTLTSLGHNLIGKVDAVLKNII